MNAPLSEGHLVERELKKYEGKAARALKLMIAGCKQDQVAKALGVTPGLVSQWCAEEDFQIQLTQDIKKGFERSLSIDDTWDDIEDKLQRKLSSMVDIFVTPEQVLRALKLANEANRKTQHSKPLEGSGDSSQGSSAGSVKLILPIVIKNQFVVNPQNEVVQVDDRNMITLNSASITTLVNEHLAREKEALSKPNLKLIDQTNEGSSNGHERTTKEDKWSDL